MNSLRRFSVILSAVLFTVAIASLQLAWNLKSTSYLRGVAERSNTNTALAVALPAYAAGKLPNPEATKELFTEKVTAETVEETLNPLYQAMSDAYTGKTDVVEFSLVPLLKPITDTGYEIPPGTVFAEETVQVGGLAPLLRTASRSLILIVLVLAGVLTLSLLLGVKHGVLRNLRNTLLLSSLLLVGLFIATLGLPWLINSLLASSGLDPAIRGVLEKTLSILTQDAGRYYLVWAIGLAIVAAILSIAQGVSHRPPQPPHKKMKKQKLQLNPKTNKAKREDW